MPVVKGTGGDSAVPAAMSAAAESRLASKCAQMEAGQVLIADAARHAVEAKEALLKESAKRKAEIKEDSSTERTQQKRDTPELSRQSKWFGIEGKLLSEADIQWTLEMEQELWEAFQAWMPLEDIELSAQLKELSRLYLALLEAVLTHTLGEGQTIQMERLNEVLSQKLNLLMEEELNELLQLLEKAGQTQAVSIVKSSVYRQTTGEPISARAADRFYTRGTMKAAGNTRFFMPESQMQEYKSGRGKKGMYTASVSSASSGGLSAASEEEGRIYHLTKGGSVRISQEFDSGSRTGEEQISQRNQVLKKAGDDNSKTPGITGGKAAVTGKELERANSFAAHMQGSGNLLKNPGISAKNEEVTGLLAALTTIKAQVYAANSGKDSALKVPVKSAINQMVDYYLAQKGVYKVYHYTTNIYEKTKNPQKAAEEGLHYAYKIFLEKKEDVTYRQQEAYSERAGFFQMLMKNQNLQADLIRGMKLLEGNWRDFLKSIGETDKKGITLTMQKHSPWGLLMEPEELGKDGKKGKEKLILTEAVCVAALVLMYLCYRLFLG